MTDSKGMQIVDKLTRHHIFSSRYWKEECFALNASTFIDKAVRIKYIGGLYSGAKKPTKFLCLVFKLLQMNLSKEIAAQYLKARDYKYLNAIALLYLRLVLRGQEAFEALEPSLADNRKLRTRNLVGEFSVMYVD
jgi:pre-mRNA-splicing factor 38A